MDRKVIFDAILRTAQFRKGAKDLEKDLDGVKKKEDEVNRSSVAGSKQSQQATEERTKANKGLLASLADVSNSAKNYARAAAQEAGQTKSVTARKKELADASRKVAEAEKAELSTKQALSRALLQTSAASTQAARARKSYLAALKNGGEAQAAKAAEDLVSATHRAASASREHEQALGRHSRALRELERVTQDAKKAELALAGAGNGVGASFRVLGSAMGGLDRAMQKVPGRLMAMAALFPVIVTGVNFLAGALSQLVGGLGSVAAAVGPAVGALATLPQVLGGAATGIGTFLSALSGVGAALKAGRTAQLNATKDAQNYADQMRSTAHAVKQAQQGVAAAHQAVGDAAREGAHSVQQAMASETDAYRQVIIATANLNQARQEAIRNLEDLKNAVKDEALSEKGASLTLQEARNRMQQVMLDPNATALDKQQAQLAVKEAQQRLAETQQSSKRAQEDYGKAQKKGVEQSDAVVQAQEAQREALKQLADAQYAVADAERQAARSRKAAAQQLAEAQYNLASAYRDQKKAQVDATSSAYAYQTALKQLSPAGQRFVQTLLSLRKYWIEIRNAAQAGLLPGLGEALTRLTRLTPIVAKGFYDMGRAMGDAAVRAARLMTTGPFKGTLRKMFAENTAIMRKDFTPAMLNVMRVLRRVMQAAFPLTRWLADSVKAWTDSWNAMTAGKAGQKRLTTFFDHTRETLAALGRLIRDTAKALFSFFGQGRKQGLGLIDSLDGIMKRWNAWNKSASGKNQIKTYFDQSARTMREFGGMLADIVKWFFRMGQNPAIANLIKQIRDQLGPALGDLFDSVGTGLGPALVTLATNMAKLLTAMGPSTTAVVKTFANALNKIADFITWGSKNIPHFRTILTDLLLAFAVAKVLSFLRVFKLLRGTFGLFTKTVDEAGNKTSKLGRAWTKLKGGAAAAGRAVTSIGRKIGSAAKGLASFARTAARKFVDVGKAAGKAAIKAGRAFAKMVADAAKAAANMAKSVAKIVAQWVRMAARALAQAARMALAWAIGVTRAAAGAIAKMALAAAAYLAQWALMAAGALASAASIALSYLIAMGPWLLIGAAIAAVVFLVIKYWKKIEKVFMDAVHFVINFVKKHWDIIKWFLGPIGLIIDQVKKHWDTIKKIFSTAIHWIVGFVKTVWSGIEKWVIDPLKSAWDGLKTVWDGIGKGFQSMWDGIKKAGRVFSGAMGKVWDGIKTVFSAPIHWIVDTVINKGIIDSINWVLDHIGLKSLELKDAPVPFSRGGQVGGGGGGGGLLPHMYARGGQVPGYGNTDSVPAVLMPGEFVLRKDAVKKLGVHRLHALNEDRSYRGGDGLDLLPKQTRMPGNTQRRLFGGLIGDITGAVGDAWDHTGGALAHKGKELVQSAWGTVKDITGKVVDLGRLGASKGLEVMFKPVRALLDHIPGLDEDTTLGKMITQRPKDAMDAAVKWIKGADEDKPLEGTVSQGFKNAISAATPMPNYTVAGGASQWSFTVSQAMQKLGLPTDQSHLNVILHRLAVESGGNPTAINRTDSNWQAGHPSVGLMQVIRGTFDAYAGPYRHVGPFAYGVSENPMANIYAGLNYAKHRYGAVGMFTRLLGTQGYARGGAVQRLARGGRATGVPALLTPGEFVLSRETASKLGPATLNRLNRADRYARGGAVRYKRGKLFGDPAPQVDLDRDARRHGRVRRFHKGGPVLGIKPGMKNKKIPLALEWMLGSGIDYTNPKWDKTLSNRLRHATASKLDGPAPHPQRMVNNLIKFASKAKVSAKKYTGHVKARAGDTLRSILQANYGDPSNKELNAFLVANGFTKHVRHTQTHTVSTPGGADPRLSAGLAFAKAQAGKPYDWGAEGPGAYDCSGFQSAVIDVVLNKPRYRRLFTTATEGGVLPRLGFRPGLGGRGDYNIGWTPSYHTSGTLLGTNIESTGDHVRWGAAARPASSSMFHYKAHLPGRATSGGTQTTTTHSTSTVADKSALSRHLKKGTKLTLPGLTKWVGAEGWKDVQKKFKLGRTGELELLKQAMPRLKKLKGHKGDQLVKDFGKHYAPISDALNALNDKLGLGSSTGVDDTISTLTRQATVHAIAHALGLTHDLLSPHPWDKGTSPTSGLTALEELAQTTERNTAAKNRYYGYIETVAGWGLKDLAEYLAGLDFTDPANMNLAKQAASNRAVATRLDADQHRANLISSDDEMNLVKMMGAISSASPPIGLRDLARNIGLSDLDTVLLAERARDAGRLKKIPAAKTNRLWKDILSYRSGTFYANVGGQVPGVGNTDSVPAMLTPGEFVLRKAAVKALGIENLHMLNDPRHFAKGGFVAEEAFSLSGPPTLKVPNGAGGRQIERDGYVDNSTTEYRVNIYNPVAEPSSKSLTKALQRRGATKGTVNENAA